MTLPIAITKPIASIDQHFLTFRFTNRFAPRWLSEWSRELDETLNLLPVDGLGFDVEVKYDLPTELVFQHVHEVLALMQRGEMDHLPSLLGMAP